ncbi:hypothetical protein QR680_018198 [Steinernema hermaphroditum]|nr:hypothetical protein QR680_018198 [Steinernema hermaphroditum]
MLRFLAPLVLVLCGAVALDSAETLFIEDTTTPYPERSSERVYGSYGVSSGYSPTSEPEGYGPTGYGGYGPRGWNPYESVKVYSSYGDAPYGRNGQEGHDKNGQCTCNCNCHINCPKE